MIASVVIKYGIWDNAGCVTKTAIRSPIFESSNCILNKTNNSFSQFSTCVCVFHTSVEHVHFHPILLFRVNHFDMDSVHHVQFGHFDVAADHVHYDFVHPIPLNRFDYDDNGLVLADLTDNIPELWIKMSWNLRNKTEVIWWKVADSKTYLHRVCRHAWYNVRTFAICTGILNFIWARRSLQFKSIQCESFWFFFLSKIY